MKLKTIFLLKNLKPLKGYAACIVQAAYPLILHGYVGCIQEEYRCSLTFRMLRRII